MGIPYWMKLCREKFSFVTKQKNPSISPDEIIYPIPVELSLDKVKMNLKGHTRHSDKLCLSYQANFPLGEVLRQTKFSSLLKMTILFKNKVIYSQLLFC